MPHLSHQPNTTKPVLSTTEEALQIAADHVSMLTDREQKLLKKHTVESHSDKPLEDLQRYQRNMATIITELLGAIKAHHTSSPKRQGFNQTSTGVFAHESYKTMARRYIEYRVIVGLIILKGKEPKEKDERS